MIKKGDVIRVEVDEEVFEGLVTKVSETAGINYVHCGSKIYEESEVTKKPKKLFDKTFSSSDDETPRTTTEQSVEGCGHGPSTNDEVAPVEGAIDIRHTADDADFIIRPGQEPQEDDYDPELDESLPVIKDDKSERLQKLNDVIPALEAVLEDFKKELDLLLEELEEDESEQ